MSVAVWRDLCAVAPSPDLRDRLRSDLQRIRETNAGLAAHIAPAPCTPPACRASTTARSSRPTSSRRAPRGADPRARPPSAPRCAATCGSIVVLVDFPDKEMTADRRSTSRTCSSPPGVLPHGSVAGVLQRGHRRPRRHRRRGRRPVADAADARLVRQRQLRHRPARPATPRAHFMAQRRRDGRRPAVDFGPYDNDGNGFVDAFVVVHAGRGGEETGNSGDIWSHKWVLPDGVLRRRHARSSPT